MITTTKTDSNIQLQSGNLCFSFLPSGDVFEVTQKSTMINQLIANPLDGSMNNIYLRVFKPDGSIDVTPMIGIRSNSSISRSESKLKWEGSFEGISYNITFHIADNEVWFWEVGLDGADTEVDLIYGQDLGLADKGAVRSNEAYMSQYIDHSVYKDGSNGYTICSRQNQPQQTGFPYIQQGALGKVRGFSTDGFQFFGLEYKETDEPTALRKTTLANEVYQYEFAYIALQSERIQLDGAAEFTFYGLFKEDHPDAVTSLEFEQEVSDAWAQVKERESVWQPVENVSSSAVIGEPVRTLSVTEDEIERLYPSRKHEEREETQLLSFFTDSNEHVVMKAKELLVERSHGHILMSGNNDRLTENVLTTTSYMVGVFNSQLVVGNTSFNKMLSNTRNALNVMKTSGQRIYVEIDGIFRLLTMPSLFEIGFNYAKWVYKLENGDSITVMNYTTVDTPEVLLSVKSQQGITYRYLITNQVTMNTNEFEAPFRMEQRDQDVYFYADSKSDSGSTFPDLAYRMHITGADVKIDDEQLFAKGAESGSASLAVLDLSPSSEWTMTIQGLLHGEDLPIAEKDPKKEIERYRAFYEDVMNGFRLSSDIGDSGAVDKLNTLAWWYTHNMLVHFSVPHGLEQYGGAAWGTRDVCQGPTEYFMATQNYRTVKEIIKTVYSHQYEDEGNWPQWFMFDKYFKIQQDDSHGDVIIWPLKVVSDYLKATDDLDILDEQIPYTERNGFGLTSEKATLLDHIKKQVAYIKRNFLHDTFLSSYGDGDWDDTLQPANQNLKQYMVSSWTVALTYQVVHQLAETLGEDRSTVVDELRKLAEGIQHDFDHFMMQNDVLPGFLYFEDKDDPKLMLHPSDEETGIDYRLIPMNRSIISELFTHDQAEAHYDTIKRHLYCPDGVRLMNRPAHYHGGVSTNFKRAEQASNFGREIGLQYVHAHIRFIEAMAKLGQREEVWSGLEIINPIGIRDVVKNADYRQSNTYFSSSDGKFNTRYEAQERFNELREGTVQVKGGWRIYSSGPGIYMNQLISNAIGIRSVGGNLVIDPVLPEKLDGLKVSYRWFDQPVTFVYHFGEDDPRVEVNAHRVNTDCVSNRYREGGFVVKQAELDALLTATDNTIDIFM